MRRFELKVVGIEGGGGAIGGGLELRVAGMEVGR